MYVKGNHPENNRSDFLLRVIIVCAFAIFIYQGIPFLLHQIIDEKRLVEEDHIKKSDVNIEEKIVIIALDRHILYKVPECLIDFEIEIRKMLNQDKYFNVNKRIVWDIAPPSDVEMRSVKHLNNKECFGDIKMLGIFTSEYDNLEVLESQLIAKMFDEAETIGGNWVYREATQLQRVPESQAIELGSNIKITSTYK